MCGNLRLFTNNISLMISYLDITLVPLKLYYIDWGIYDKKIEMKNSTNSKPLKFHVLLCFWIFIPWFLLADVLLLIY